MRNFRFKLGQHGGSMVEFAVVAPVMVSLVLYATFFWDAMRTKLRTQEAANFYAWEFTSLPMSDYLTSGQAGHAGLFSHAKGLIDSDFQARYKSLDSSDPTNKPSFIAKTGLAGNTGKAQVTDNKAPLVSTQAVKNLGLGAIGGAVASFANSGLDTALSKFDFDINGMVSVKVSTEMQNIILPADFMNTRFANTKLTPLTTITFNDTRALIIDDWAVNDGADSDLNDVGGGIWGSRGSTGQVHPMAAQVNRMAFLGLKSFIPGLGAFESLASGILPDPLGVPVASFNYWKTNNPGTPQGPNCASKFDANNHGCIDYKKEGRKIDAGITIFQTIPIRTTSEIAANPSSPMYEVFSEGGPWYMGCPNAEHFDKNLGEGSCHGGTP